jgi:hypothetical protein
MTVGFRIPLDLSLVLSAAAEHRFPERHQIRDRVAIELTESFVKAHPRTIERLDASSTDDEAVATSLASEDGFWRQIEELMEHADEAAPQYPTGSLADRWKQRAIKNLDGPKLPDDSASLDLLSNCASEYCQSYWASSPTLELWLVRQMIYAETFALSREFDIPPHVKSFGYWWRGAKNAVRWLLGFGVGIGMADVYGPGAGLLSFASWLAITSYLARHQFQGLLERASAFLQMRNAYTVSMRNPACPVDIERALALAEDQRAVWPTGLRILVEKAMSRDRSMWFPPIRHSESILHGEAAKR